MNKTKQVFGILCSSRVYQQHSFGCRDQCNFLILCV